MPEDIVIRARVKADLSDLKRQLKGLSSGYAGGAAASAKPHFTLGGGGGAGGKEEDKKGGGLGSALASIAGTLMKKTAGAITGGILLVFDKFLDPLLDIVALLALVVIIIASIASMVGGILIPILLGLSIISKGVFDSFKDVGRILSAMAALIGKMVSPFINLLIPLLIPVLYVLGIMAKIFNATVRPLFALMMKIFSQPLVSLGQLVAQLLGGEIDIAGFVSGVVAIFQNAINMVVASPQFQQFMSQFAIYLGIAINALKAFLELSPDQIRAAFAQVPVIGPLLGELAVIIQYLISAVAGFAAQLVGKENFDKWFGEGEFEKLKTTNTGFETGVNIASALQQLWTILTETIIPQLQDWANKLVQNPIGTIWDTVVGGLTSVMVGKGKSLDQMEEDRRWTGQEGEADLGTIFSETGLVGVFQTLVEKIQGWITNCIDKIVLEMTTFLTTQWETFKTSFGSWITEIDNWVADMITNTPGQILADAIAEWLDDQTPPGGGDSEDDFVMRPGQGPVSFSPSDTIIGVKDPSKLGGGGGTVFNVSMTINGTGLNERQLQDAVEAAMENVASRQSRNGYYQRGY